MIKYTQTEAFSAHTVFLAKFIKEVSRAVNPSSGLQKDKDVVDRLTAAWLRVSVSVDTAIVRVAKSPYNLTGLQ